MLLKTPDTVSMRTALTVLSVCSFASPSPAVGLLCDGACMKRIGGTFHTLGAAWWGVGSGLTNRVHLAKSRGPQDSLVQPRFTDQSGVIPASSSHTHPWRPLLLGVLVAFHPPNPQTYPQKPSLPVQQSAQCSPWNTPHPPSCAWTTCFSRCPWWTLKPWLWDFLTH